MHNKTDALRPFISKSAKKRNVVYLYDSRRRSVSAKCSDVKNVEQISVRNSKLGNMDNSNNLFPFSALFFLFQKRGIWLALSVSHSLPSPLSCLTARVIKNSQSVFCALATIFHRWIYVEETVDFYGAEYSAAHVH